MINEKTGVTYRDLIDQFFAWITNNVHNVEVYSPHVPASARPGYTFTERYSRGGYTVTIVESSLLPVVTQAQINKDFNNFMATHGVFQKENLDVTSRGLLNFWANVASFCAPRLVLISGQYIDQSLIMYKSGPASYDRVVEVDNLSDAVDANDINAMTRGLLSVTNPSKLHKITYKIDAFCSCTSSSSSSSSSSSMFVAYMKG